MRPRGPINFFFKEFCNQAPALADIYARPISFRKLNPERVGKMVILQNGPQKLIKLN
jgi:hypothetical protein